MPGSDHNGADASAHMNESMLSRLRRRRTSGDRVALMHPPAAAAASATSNDTAASPSKPESTFRWFLGQMRWLLYQYAVLASVMGVGIRWVWMLVRTIAFGTVMANGFLWMIWWYLSSPFTIRRVRYSERLVPRTPLKLAHLRAAKEARRRQHLERQRQRQIRRESGASAVGAAAGAAAASATHGDASPSPVAPGKSAETSAVAATHVRTPSTSSASSDGADSNAVVAASPQRGTADATRQFTENTSILLPTVPLRRHAATGGSSNPDSGPVSPGVPVKKQQSGKGGSGPNTPSRARAARQPTGFDESVTSANALATGRSTPADIAEAASDLDATHAAAAAGAGDDDDDDLDLNNRAYLDIHMPVPVDALLAGRGIRLEDVLPPQRVADGASSSSSATPVVRHHRRRSSAGEDKLRAAQLRRERKSQQHPASLVGLRHAPEVYVPPTTPTQRSSPPSSAGDTPRNGTTNAGNGNDDSVTFPVIICVTGGAWIIGVHYWMAMMARVLSACGFIVVTPDYRNFPAALIPDMVDDVDDAIAWTIANIGRFHGDPRRIYVLGQSAGAHLVTMSLLRQVAALDAQQQQAAANGTNHGGGVAGGSTVTNASISTNATDDEEAELVTPAYHPERDIRAFIGLSGMYDLSGMADYLHSRGLYRGVLKRLCAGDVVGCSALAQLAEADAHALAKYLPRTMLYLHGNSDTSAPPSESAHMAAVLRGKMAEVVAAAAAKYGAQFALAIPTPIVKLHVLSGATHTTPIVEDMLTGRSETAALIVALAKKDAQDDAEAAARRQRSNGRSPSPRQHVNFPAGLRHADEGSSAADAAALDASFTGLAGSMTLTAETAAALQLTLGRNAPSTAAGGTGHHHRAPALKFRPLLWRWQASLASFVSAF